MFGLFRKKTEPRAAKAEWLVSQGQMNGKPIFVRRNQSAASLVGHPSYRFRVGVAVSLLKPRADGLPANAEMEVLNLIEDKLCSALESSEHSLHVLAITTQSMREFVFYTRSPDAAAQAIESVRASVQTHELQSYVEEDPQWEVYAQFA